MKLKFILAGIPFFVGAFVQAQTSSPLDDYILAKMKDARIPGIVFAIIKDGKVAMTKGYGYADLDKDIPFTPNTIHHEIISESKIVTATAIMKLWEQGKFQLDDPINNYLPFQIKNPYYQNSPITFRMLLSHTSSLANEQPEQNFWVAPGTAEELGAYLQDLLVPGGSLYNSSKYFINYPPGTQYSFSNNDYAILGYLVQRISGIPFDQYCYQNIFQPLCMNHTAWYHSQLDTNIISHPYYYAKGSSSINRPIDFGLYEVPIYPAVQLKTTVIDWSRFLQMHLNYGKLNGIRIIDSTTELMMRSAQLIADTNKCVEHDNATVCFRRDECFGYYHVIEFTNDNKEYFGRNGADIGTFVQSWFNQADRTIITVYCNGGYGFLPPLFAVFDIYEQLNLIIANGLSVAQQPNLDCNYSFNPCEQNLDYWKNNPDNWALNSMPMKLGTKHYYSKNQILDLLNRPVNSDASLVLAKALITAKFNIAQGSEISPIIQTVNAAMNLISDHRLPYDNAVAFFSPTGIQMLALAATLNSYNSGSMNTIACTANSTIQNANITAEMAGRADKLMLSIMPNPFSQFTEISFTVLSKGKTLVAIFDLNGHLVKKLADQEFENGEHHLRWDATNVSAGVYFLRLQSGGTIQVKKLVVVK
jgi:CubicO group peptidase (beta-lactamase class C family)